MKFCPYCGAELVDSTVSFCGECGKALPDGQKKEVAVISEPESDTKKSRKKKKKPPKKRRSKKKADTEQSEIKDDGYDGYYDDIIPMDEGYRKEGVDKELIKKVVLIILGVLLVVAACVAIMYLL